MLVFTDHGCKILCMFHNAPKSENAFCRSAPFQVCRICYYIKHHLYISSNTAFVALVLSRTYALGKKRKRQKGFCDENLDIACCYSLTVLLAESSLRKTESSFVCFSNKALHL